MPLAAIKVGDSVQTALDNFFGFLPKLIGFLIILAIGFLIAKVVKGIITKALQKLGVDRALHEGHAGQVVNRVLPNAEPSSTVGAIAFWFIFLGAVAIAVSQLGIQALDTFVASISAYLPNVIAAVLIFVVAGVIAGAVGGLVARTMGDTPTGKAVGTIVPGLVMVIATFMILNQLQIAPEIVTITYTAILAAFALAMALAFGLGGRDVAARMLSEAYDKGQQNKGQVKQDAQLGKERAQQDAQRAKQEAQARTGAGPATQQTTAQGAVAPERRNN